MKKRLTQSEEFEILKLVIDKFLWLGVAMLGIGLYRMYTGIAENMFRELSFMISGVIILGLLVYMLVREYEVVK